MATYHGTARTNFVRVKDVKAALADLEPFGNNTQVHDSVPDARTLACWEFCGII